MLVVNWEHGWHLTVHRETAWCWYSPQFVDESCSSSWCSWQHWDLVVMEWLLLSQEERGSETSQVMERQLQRWATPSAMRAADLKQPLLLGVRPELSASLQLQRPTEFGGPFPKRCHYFYISIIINSIFSSAGVLSACYLNCFQSLGGATKSKDVLLSLFISAKMPPGR